MTQKTPPPRSLAALLRCGLLRNAAKQASSAPAAPALSQLVLRKPKKESK